MQALIFPKGHCEELSHRTKHRAWLRDWTSVWNMPVLRWQMCPESLRRKVSRSRGMINGVCITTMELETPVSHIQSYLSDAADQAGTPIIMLGDCEECGLLSFGARFLLHEQVS